MRQQRRQEDELSQNEMRAVGQGTADVDSEQQQLVKAEPADDEPVVRVTTDEAKFVGSMDEATLNQKMADEQARRLHAVRADKSKVTSSLAALPERPATTELSKQYVHRGNIYVSNDSNSALLNERSKKKADRYCK